MKRAIVGCVERLIRQSNLESLPLYQQSLHALIREPGSVTPQGLHQRYENVSEPVYENRGRVPVARRAWRNKRRRLNEYGLITVVGANRHREYRVVDNDVNAAQSLEELPPLS